MMEAATLYIMVVIVLSGTCQAALWSYAGSENWPQLFPTACAGQQQSPIDILPEQTIYSPNLKDFAIWYDPPKKSSKMFVKNNGHTIQVDLEGDFYVTNGGLSSVYKSVQFHFHWGHAAHHGSEHRIDGKTSPIEMHLVSYNHEMYSGISEAVTEKGGLAVLGTIYEISEEDNPALEVIIAALKDVKDPETQDRISIPLISLRDLLPEDISRYYRYNGSLTTPGCFESVIWTVFDTKQSISLSQLKEFTTVMQYKHKHKKGKKKQSHRNRRSMTKAQRQQEQNAEYVLEELGIKGDEYEEAVFKSELMQKQIMADMPQDEAVITVKQLKPTLDEDRAGKIDKAIDHHQGESASPRHKSESRDSNHEEEEVVEDDVYIQEILVNNFRHIQPLNDRIVYRSFKLRDTVITKVDVEEHQSHSAKSTSQDDYDSQFRQGNSANHHTLLTIIIFTAPFFSFLLI